jgi:hypothetical protein
MQNRVSAICPPVLFHTIRQHYAQEPDQPVKQHKRNSQSALPCLQTMNAFLNMLQRPVKIGLLLRLRVNAIARYNKQ